MPNCSQNDVVLAEYPFSDLSTKKVLPALVVNAPHVSGDLFIVPLTSRIQNLLMGECVLTGWKNCGLNVPTAVKRGVFTIHTRLIIKPVGRITVPDQAQLEHALRNWLDLK
jgi:mRNA interferase MazF